MKQLTGFIPIAALPPSTAAWSKKELLSTIEWLQSEGAPTETNLKLLTAIVESILWSEESYTRFFLKPLRIKDFALVYKLALSGYNFTPVIKRPSAYDDGGAGFFN